MNSDIPKTGNKQEIIHISVEQYLLMKQRIKLLTKLNKELSNKNKELESENEYLKTSLDDAMLPNNTQYVDAGEFPTLQTPKLVTTNISLDSNLSLNPGH
mmetsp:Transcript_64128/g.78428  ORF Transcript_64128/g.78428 Transcript_64128/m.78428 type:complete len:100 (+) Transcript_64128:55-354(+)